MRAVRHTGSSLAKLRLRVQSRLPWPTAHDQTTAFLIPISLSLVLMFMLDAVLEQPSQPLDTRLLTIALWLPLLLAEVCLPSRAAPVALRMAFLSGELALMLALGWLNGFQVASYLLFTLVGQAALILNVPGALVFLLVVTVARVLTLHANGRDAATPISSDASWLVGASFVVLAVKSMRHALDQRWQITNLVAGLEAAKIVAEAQSQELERQALEDQLTGLHNRRFMDMDLPREFDRARRFKHHLSVAMIDLDNFKEINDGHSHQVGDDVLAELGGIMRKATRSVDGVVRYGGDEFLVYFPETSLEAGVLACERIRQAVVNTDWPRFGQGINVKLSIGVAAVDGQANLDELIAQADARLLEAKRQGKNRIVSAD